MNKYQPRLLKIRLVRAKYKYHKPFEKSLKIISENHPNLNENN